MERTHCEVPFRFCRVDSLGVLFWLCVERAHCEIVEGLVIVIQCNCIVVTVIQQDCITARVIGTEIQRDCIVVIVIQCDCIVAALVA